MLKIKDNVKLEEIKEKYGLYTEEYHADRDYEFDIERVHTDGNIFINVETRGIYEENNEDNAHLEMLYDLIKADLVEKVSDGNE